jgi:hypothetical protein
MNQTTSALAGMAVAISLAAVPVHLGADVGDTRLTLEQQEEFLRTARIVTTHGVSKGVTNTVRVTMTDGRITHDASVQRIDEHRTTFEKSTGGSELNFKDSYKFNVAGWRLARLLGLGDMVPPSVERKFQGQSAAFTWWIDDVLMDEVGRTSKKMQPPDQDRWNSEMYLVRVFDQLIFNTDRNMTNLLIDKQWRIWMIDHTRAFRTQRTLLDARNLVKCDRTLLAKMKDLDAPTLERELAPYANNEEVRGLLARRDRIVQFFESKGSGALYDRPQR